MSKLEEKTTYRPESRNGNRFYTQRDMATIKRDEAALNSMRKRGEAPPLKGNGRVVVCGCGVEGCFLHTQYTNEELKGKGLFNHKR